MFIEVLRDRAGASILVEPDVTSGDYLDGFLRGTRRALYENGRESITITIRYVNAYTIGTLIALFERVVGLYAVLINVNAYHQPGVEAGKKAASAVIELQRRVLRHLIQNGGRAFSAAQLASEVGAVDEVETVFRICEHLAANPDRGVTKAPGESPFEAKYKLAR